MDFSDGNFLNGLGILIGSITGVFALFLRFRNESNRKIAALSRQVASQSREIKITNSERKAMHKERKELLQKIIVLTRENVRLKERLRKEKT